MCLNNVSFSVSLFITFRSKKFPFHKFLFLPREEGNRWKNYINIISGNVKFFFIT